MSPRTVRVYSTSIAVASLLATAAPAVAAGDACPGADAIPDAADLELVADATLCLVNAQRARRGRPPLRESSALTRAATRYSRLMVSRRFFGHVAPWGEDLKDRLLGAGYIRRGESWQGGENLAWGTGSLSSPAAIIDGWMRSRPHRANLLDARRRRIGTGVAAGTPARGTGRSGATYTLDFGSLNRNTGRSP